MNKKELECDHEFAQLGFDVYKVTDTSVEAVAAIFCEKCGMFRTKILTFRREITDADTSRDGNGEESAKRT